MNKDIIINSLLKSFIDSRNIILFGAGRRGEEVAKIIEKDDLGEIAFFIDNGKKESFMWNIPIYKIDKLLKIDKNNFKIIVCTDSKEIYSEITKVLIDLGLRENENFISSKILRNELVSNKDNPYEGYEIQATYAPWLEDLEFLNYFYKIKQNTLVDIYRCYELWSLVEQSSKIGKGIFLEIGVWRGGTGSLIAKKVELLKIKEPVYLCDTFTGVVKASEKDDFYKGEEHCDTSEQYVKELIDELKLNNVKILKGVFPDETKEYIKEKTIRFCHIDVDVYESAKDIINFIWDKMEIGGIIVFDDFGFKTCKGVTKLVNEINSEKDKVILENLNGHAIVIKVK